MIEDVAPAPDVTLDEPPPVIEQVAPPPDVFHAVPAPVIERVVPAPAVICTAPAPEIEHVAPAPAVTHAKPVPVIEYVAPAPDIEYIAPAPSVTFATPGQQLPPAHVMAAVTTGVSRDTTVVVNPHCLITAVEASVPQVDGSISPLDEFAAPVYNQVHQLLLMAERMGKLCETIEMSHMMMLLFQTLPLETQASTSRRASVLLVARSFTLAIAALQAKFASSTPIRTPMIGDRAGGYLVDPTSPMRSVRVSIPETGVVV